MADDKLRREIAFEAARLMYLRHETEYFRAKRKAARKICSDWIKPKDLPNNREIREQIQQLARLHEGETRIDKLREMRFEALRIMRLMRPFRPKLIGSTLTGHVRRGSDIDIHVFSNSLEAVESVLQEEGLTYDVEHKRVRKYGEERVFTHLHLLDGYRFELTMYAEDKANYVFKSSVTGQAMERATIPELEQLLAREYPDSQIEKEVAGLEERVDRFLIYRALLIPLESVMQSQAYHPEGDALYHSLQVFDRARDELPYDEEFLLAALLHDVGKAIDPHAHVQAALTALEGTLTPRTQWLIEHHMEAHGLADGTLGARARRRLEESPDFEDLILLGECDRKGRERGAHAPDVEDALDYIRDLARMYG